MVDYADYIQPGSDFLILGGFLCGLVRCSPGDGKNTPLSSNELSALIGQREGSKIY